MGRGIGQQKYASPIVRLDLFEEGGGVEMEPRFRVFKKRSEENLVSIEHFVIHGEQRGCAGLGDTECMPAISRRAQHNDLQNLSRFPSKGEGLS